MLMWIVASALRIGQADVHGPTGVLRADSNTGPIASCFFRIRCNGWWFRVTTSVQSGGETSLPIVTTEDGVLPVGVGGPAAVSEPLLESISNTDTLSDWEFTTNKCLPEGSTLSETGPSSAVTPEPIEDNAPFAE